jgi:hypothetical protein
LIEVVFTAPKILGSLSGSSHSSGSIFGVIHDAKLMSNSAAVSLARF